MVGVLQSQFGAYDDSVPLPGGGGMDNYFDAPDYVPLPGGDGGDFYFNPPDIGDYQPVSNGPTAQPPAPSGPLSVPVPAQAMPPDTTPMGPLAASSPQALQMSLIDRAQQRINDYRQQQAAARQGSVNLPLLSAAGALLAPTRTGSFGESLGNAMSAAAPVLQRQRQMESQDLENQAKQDWNIAYQQAVLQDRGTWRDIQQQKADQERDRWHTTPMVDENGNPVLANGKGELKVDTSIKIGAKPSAEGDWKDTGRNDPNGNPIQFNRNTGQYRVNTDVTIGAKPGSGTASASAILAREGLAKANAQIQQENEVRAAAGKPPLSDAEVADIRINNVNGAKSANMPQSAKAQIIQMAVAAADDDLKNIPNPTPEQIREARIKRISEYTRRTSVYGQTVNALKRDVLDNWIAADPSIVDDPARFAVLNSKVNGGMIIKPPQALAMEDRAQQTVNAVDAIRRLRQHIGQVAVSAGALGRPLRGAETIGNILQMSDDTTRADIESDLALIRNLLPTLLTSKGPHPSSPHAIAELNKIFRGGNWGDTYQNVMSNSETMMKLLGGDLKHMNEFYKDSLGRNLSVFAPGGKQQPLFSPGQTGNAPASERQPAPQAPARPSPQSAAPSESAGFTPDVSMLKAGKVTRFDDGSAWTVVNGKAVQVK